MWLVVRQKTLFLPILFFIFPAFSFAENTSELLQRFRQAESDTAVAEALAQQGQERGQFCFRCHGEDGNSRRDYVPNLASQNAAYLFTQFEKFANGERENFVMSKLAGSLTADERVAIAVYFSDKPVLVRETRPAPDLKGQKIYQSLCFACHGERGHGGENYPRIAGQPYEFLEQTLLKFRAGDASRANSPMTAVVSNMKEDDLKAVASWVANMP